MRPSISLLIALIWGAVMAGCAGPPEQLGESALARQRIAASEIRTALESFIDEANRDAAEADDIIYISEATFDRIAFYVPLHTPVDFAGPEPSRAEVVEQNGPYPSSLPPSSARHREWSEDIIFAQQASSRFRLLEVTSIEHEPGSKRFTAKGLLERTVRKRETTVRIGKGVPSSPEGYRLWEAEFVFESRIAGSPMPRYDFPTFLCAGQPYGAEDSSFENHPNWLEQTINNLKDRPFEEEGKVFSLTATYSTLTGKWSIRSSRPDEIVPLLTTPDWSSGLSIDERKSVFPPKVLDLIPQP